MRRLQMLLILTAALTASSCGRPTEKSPPPSSEKSVERKCPDPSIHDSSDPCSPNYYKPVQGSFRGDKGL